MAIAMWAQYILRLRTESEFRVSIFLDYNYIVKFVSLGINHRLSTANAPIIRERLQWATSNMNAPDVSHSNDIGIGSLIFQG